MRAVGPGGWKEYVVEIRAAREIVVVLNDIGLFPDQSDPSLYSYDPAQNAIWNTAESKVLRWDPATRSMRDAPELRGGFTTGEVVRFRMLNANSDNLMPLVVEGYELHLLALDGVNFPAPRTIPAPPASPVAGDAQLLLAPANRAEFLLRGGERGGAAARHHPGHGDDAELPDPVTGHSAGRQTW